MRLAGMFICGVLLSVQGFAVKGYAGKSGTRQLKELLHNRPLIEKLSSALGATPIGINSGTLIGGKILAATAGLGLMFAVATTDASSIEKRAQAADKQILSAKVVELGDGVKLDYGGRIGGSYSNSSGKPDNFSFGVELGSTLSRELSSLEVKGSFLSTRTKAVGADDYSGAEDWIGRATFVQEIPTAGDIKPIVYINGGFSHYGDKKRSADGTGGIGVSARGTLFGKQVHLQLRGGFGWLGEGAYDKGMDSYADIEGDTVGVFGATVKTEWTSVGDVLQAEDGSLLYYVPLIPAATTFYNEYRPLGGDGDFDDVTRRAESTINILRGLGVTLKYDGKKGEEAAKSAQITYSYGF